MDEPLSILDIVIRLGVAMIGGGILGWEREANEKPAGVKTHILVTVGTAGYALIALELMGERWIGSESVRSDPLRLIQAIATGVGFLGAGAIIQSGGQVRGLTTAASIWVAAAVGVAAGFGMYTILIGLVVFSLITLTVMRTVEKRVRGK